jgi:uncharacterized protein (TIGR02147 family)
MVQKAQAIRPVVYDYSEPGLFFRDLGEYYRKTRRGFSVRSKSKNLLGCSPALISQVISGKRKLKRDQLSNFCYVFSLNSSEVQFIDELLKSSKGRISAVDRQSDQMKVKPRVAKNHLLADWLHPYVKDLIELKNFKMEARWFALNLGGIAKLSRIEKSIEFLFREGFWRRTQTGKVVLDEAAALTTNEIPNEKIKNFHRHALKIAAKGLEDLPVQRRKASTVLVAVNSNSRDELRTMINKFQNDLIQFIETHSGEKDELVQVVVHMTPIGGQRVHI